ncbi:MAG: SPASM domain-containing protein, partial [Candidatus Odinarchaeota archaeon]
PPIHPLNNYLKNIPKEKLRNYFGCGAATYKCGIKANGDIVPCLLFKQGVGNIKTNSIEKIWNGIYFSLLRDMISLRKKVCNDCSAESYCDSGCPLVSFIYYRNFIEKDQSCPVIYSERYLWKKKII